MNSSLFSRSDNQIQSPKEMKVHNHDHIVSNQNIMLTIGNNFDDQSVPKNNNNIQTINKSDPPKNQQKIGFRNKPKYLTLGNKGPNSRGKMIKSKTQLSSRESMTSQKSLNEKRISYQFFEKFTGRRISQSEYYEFENNKEMKEEQEVFYATEKIENLQRCLYNRTPRLL